MTSDDNDLLMDWSLRECLGEESPPDLVAAVRARRAVQPPPKPPIARFQRIGIAAAVLAGTAIVIFVLATRGSADANQPAAQPTLPPQHQDPLTPHPEVASQPAQVSSRQQIDALPAATREVIATGLGDDDIPALLRLKHLSTLRLKSVWPSPMGPNTPLVPSGLISDAALEHIAGMDSLKTLHLDGQIGLSAKGLAALVHLSSLEQLELVYCTADEDAYAVLSRLPKLKSLRLETCTKIGHRTLERIAGMDSLRKLSLRANTHLEANSLMLLGTMTKLDSLDLSMIGSRTMFTGLAPVDLPEPGTGVTHDVVHAIAGMKSLRILDLSHGTVSPDALSELQSLPLVTLKILGADLGGPVTFPPTVTHLDLSGAQRLPEGLGAFLAENNRKLASLRLNTCPVVDDEMIASLAALPYLQYLDLSHCSTLTAESVPSLLTMKLLRNLDLRGLNFVTEAHRVQLRALPQLSRLITDAGAETLRDR